MRRRRLVQRCPRRCRPRKQDRADREIEIAEGVTIISWLPPSSEGPAERPATTAHGPPGPSRNFGCLTSGIRMILRQRRPTWTTGTTSQRCSATMPTRFSATSSSVCKRARSAGLLPTVPDEGLRKTSAMAGVPPLPRPGKLKDVRMAHTPSGCHVYISGRAARTRS